MLRFWEFWFQLCFSFCNEQNNVWFMIWINHQLSSLYTCVFKKKVEVEFSPVIDKFNWNLYYRWDWFLQVFCFQFFSLFTIEVLNPRKKGKSNCESVFGFNTLSTKAKDNGRHSVQFNMQKLYYSETHNIYAPLFFFWTAGLETLVCYVKIQR